MPLRRVEDVAKAYRGESLGIIEKAMEKEADETNLYQLSGSGSGIQQQGQHQQWVSDFKGLRVSLFKPHVHGNHGQAGGGTGYLHPPDRVVYGFKTLPSLIPWPSLLWAGIFKNPLKSLLIVTKMNMSYPTILVCMNLQTWKGLPGDVQETLVSLGKKQEAVTLAMSKGWEQKFHRLSCTKVGATVTTISPEERRKDHRHLPKVIWEAWAQEERQGGQAPSGHSIWN